MLDLYELKQLVAFADLGTLSKVAEAFHISTPSITRSMQHLEESFGVPLFIRGKNRIELNATGEAAVEYGRKLLQETEQTVAQVRAFDLRQRTIVIRSCAPAPLWELMKKLNAAYPDRTISSAICQNEEVMTGWKMQPAILRFFRRRWKGHSRLCGNIYMSVCRRTMSWRGMNP